mmetsp:Transcript_49256/g.105327  ORF Transcript_49256/g.105327 Transcript_49256/m.105327 type:complete len:310 (+) Transcript_49256:528-1457(+)
MPFMRNLDAHADSQRRAVGNGGWQHPGLRQVHLPEVEHFQLAVCAGAAEQVRILPAEAAAVRRPQVQLALQCASAAADVVHSDVAVHVGSRKLAIVAGEGRVEHRSAVGLQLLHHLGLRPLPHQKVVGLSRTAREDELPALRDGTVEDTSIMAAERLEALAAARAPDLHGGIMRSRQEEPGVGAPADAVHRVDVLLKYLLGVDYGRDQEFAGEVGICLAPRPVIEVALHHDLVKVRVHRAEILLVLRVLRVPQPPPPGTTEIGPRLAVKRLIHEGEGVRHPYNSCRCAPCTACPNRCSSHLLQRPARNA